MAPRQDHLVPVSASRELRVVSWNIRHGEDHQLAAKQLQRIESLRDADIVLLQEMDEQGTAALANTLGARYAFTFADLHRHSGREFGNAIVSRWPIEDVAEIELPHMARYHGQPRSATRATVTVAGTAINAYSVHTEIRSLRLARRMAQFDTIAQDVGRRLGEAVVVGGDFNTVTARDVSSLQSAMSAAGLGHVSLGAGTTYRRFGRVFTLDHVFAAGFSCSQSGVAPDATASDHLPVWARLTPRQ